MSFSDHSAFLCDRLLNMFCSAAYKSAPPFGHIKVELCPGLESNSWTKSAKPQCLCGIILFVLLYRNRRCGARCRLLSYIKTPCCILLYAYYLSNLRFYALILPELRGALPTGFYFFQSNHPFSVIRKEYILELLFSVCTTM